MSDATHISETDAIIQVISEGGVGDFIDVVNAVEKRFRLTVTSAQVEDVFYELQKRSKELESDQPTVVETEEKKTKVRPGSRVSLGLTTQMPEIGIQPASVQAKSTPALQAHSVKDLSAEPPRDDLGHALLFVKAVGGLAKAKKALIDLETALLGE